jgi:hypothetical protein
VTVIDDKATTSVVDLHALRDRIPEDLRDESDPILLLDLVAGVVFDRPDVVAAHRAARAEDSRHAELAGLARRAELVEAEASAEWLAAWAAGDVEGCLSAGRKAHDAVALRWAASWRPAGAFEATRPAAAALAAGLDERNLLRAAVAARALRVAELDALTGRPAVLPLGELLAYAAPIRRLSFELRSAARALSDSGGLRDARERRLATERRDELVELFSQLGVPVDIRIPSVDGSRFVGEEELS